MNKRIVSVHGEPCTIDTCPHQKVCYHRKRIGESDPSFLIQLLQLTTDETEFYLSVCDNKVFDTTLKMMEGTQRSNKVSYTMSYDTFMKYRERMYEHGFRENSPGLQVSVYSLEALENLSHMLQKLFLIKDEESYNIAIRIFDGETKCMNVHFPIDQEWAEKNPKQLLTLINKWNNKTNDTLSLDSCLENMLLNHECAYMENYVDINFDKTYRRCPFKAEGKPIPNNVNEMFDDKEEPDCIYYRMFGGKDDNNNNVGTE